MSDTPRRRAFGYKKTGARAKGLGSVKFDLNDEKDITCIGDIDGLTILEFAGLAGISEDSSPQEQAAAAGSIRSFLITVITPLDYPRFEKAVKEPDSGVGVEELAEIAGWIVEQYVDRPTPPS